MLFQLMLLVGPDMGDRDVEAENAAAECIHESSQPILQVTSPAPLFRAHPVCKLRDDNRAGEAPFAFLLMPEYSYGVWGNREIGSA